MKNEGEPELQINAKVKNSGKLKDWSKTKKMSGASRSGGGGLIYCVGLIGSLIYWTQAAVGFGAVVTGILKSLAWPAYVVYKLLENFYGVVN